MGQRQRTWWRWVARPWRSAGLIVALIASFALPAFMAASADAFLVSASTSITRQILDDHPTGLDVSLVAGGRLDGAGVAGLDAVVRDEFARVGRLGAPRRIVYADLELQRPTDGDGSPPAAIIGSAGRFVAVEGALDAIEVVDGDRDVDGVWISARLSERLDLPAGALVSVAGGDAIPIAGVFADLWEGDRDPFWDELPPAFVPRLSRVLSAPLFEIMIVSEDLLLDLGTDGLVRWDATVADRPDSLAEMVEYRARLRNVERSYTESPDMAGALAAFAGVGSSLPMLSSDAFDLYDEIERTVAELDQPIAVTAFGGIVLGLVVTAAGAAFAVRKRETEVRLLRADGDAAWRFAARALVQFAAPAALGALIGVAAAVVLVAAPGDGARPALDVVDVESIALVALVGLAVAAAVTAVASSRVQHAGRSAVGGLRPAWVLPVVGVALASWVQVDAEGDAARVDPLVISFPLVGLIAGVGMVVIGARWLMRRVQRSGGSLPVPLFLAWRRITSTDSSAALLSASFGVSLGLVVFSSTLVTGLDTAADAKATTAVGGVSQAVVDGRFEVDLPPETTLVSVFSSRSTIGGGSVNVVAIDPATYPAAVSWHPSFGSSPADVARRLAAGETDAGGTDAEQSAAGRDVPAIVAGRLPVSSNAGFGTSYVTSYTVVDSIASAPLASAVFPTLLVSAPAVDAAARRDHDASRPPDVEAQDWAESFRSPLQRARSVLLSQLDEAELAEFLADNGVQVRELVTLADQRDLVGNRAARWTFEYVSLLAVVAGLAALGTLFFYLSEQQARRQLSSVMLERIGVRRGAASLAAVAEVLGLVVVAFVAGVPVGLVVASRVFGRFEPDQRLPPDVGLGVSWPLVAVIAAVATAAVVIAALVTQWRSGRRSYAEVLRGA